MTKSHRVYEFRDRGPVALEPAKRASLAALEERLHTRTGVVESMVQQVSKAVVMMDIAIDHIQLEREAGKSLNDIPLAKALPAFNNSAVRALRTLYDILPDGTGVISAEEVLSSYRRVDSDKD